ncbi:MAG: hypothetical protein K2N03_00695, partial [Muribaculaceae bacterium]|nr:hypothetical protein [Muribaculaceae bacterium]
HIPQLIVMLTHNDYTVENAEEIFEECKDTDALYWGMKEKPLPKDRMKSLFKRMKECGKLTALEVVGYTESEGLAGAQLARDCGCDILMGTRFFAPIAKFCKENNILYFPFIGEIEGRPSILKGSVDGLVDEAERDCSEGAYGVDLLGYRCKERPSDLIRGVVNRLSVPVIVAGSIDSNQKLDEIIDINPWGFTIGSAFFENKFGEGFPAQINSVCKIVRGEDTD